MIYKERNDSMTTNQNDITIDRLKESLEISKDFLNTINTSGLDNYQKIIAVYNNLQAIITLIDNGTMRISTENSDDSQSA